MSLIASLIMAQMNLTTSGKKIDFHCQNHTSEIYRNRVYSNSSSLASSIYIYIIVNFYIPMGIRP